MRTETTVVYKYPLEVADEQTLLLPRDAVILCVQAQDEAPCLWAWVDPDEPAPRRAWTVRIVGTGHPIAGHPGTYRGTFQLADGRLVFHVFADPREEAASAS